LFVFSAVFVFFRGVVRFFRVIRFSVLSILPRCSFCRVTTNGNDERKATNDVQLRNITP
jgi:hypothetical protein